MVSGCCNDPIHASSKDLCLDRKLLIRTALRNLSGQETALATDPDASLILERLLYSMDDFAQRVLADQLTGLYFYLFGPSRKTKNSLRYRYAKLAQHQFASHVLQTLFTLGAETVEREVCRLKL